MKPKSQPASSKADPRIDCRECVNFYITWQISTPYGCKAHGFKSAQIPSMVVFTSSGEHCLLFCRKRKHESK
ncbi:MAG: uracil-DNA glycosylase [Erysipelotrichia bacterium]|nr:uracil-DNA glycosylase [Erysipelotrichia bacterium]